MSELGPSREGLPADRTHAALWALWKSDSWRESDGSRALDGTEAVTMKRLSWFNPWLELKPQGLG